MNWIEGSDRQQTQLLPAALEDYVGPDNLVRFLDAFAATLDLRAAGFVFPKEDPQGRGRPAYHPADLLKLYLYGYLNQLRSSRRLEAECRRNLEVLWLLRQLTPDFKTIADFRKDNAVGFKAVVREFTRLCRQLDLFGGQLLAIDGTKIKASTAADQGQLAPVAQAAKTELQIPRADVVADGGYYQSQDIKACQEMGVEPHLPAVQNSPSERAGLYGKSDFRYDAAKDLYHCPGGAQLSCRRQMAVEGKIVFNYDNPKACGGCALKAHCTKARYRTVSRWEHEASLERMAAVVAAAPEKLAARKTLIEHCWGTVKWLLPGGFLVRGKVKVGAEVGLAHFGYNLKRALTVLGLAKLLAALRNFKPDGWLGPTDTSAPLIFKPNAVGALAML
ncbi:MAG TPA: transposase [Verrucomicrobiae bacterium]|nr:transposase [Verrucomicrobiae bacterium]